jgi:hypothetical protein
MNDDERRDRTPPMHPIWSEALWSMGLVGFVLLLTLLASALVRP